MGFSAASCCSRAKRSILARGLTSEERRYATVTATQQAYKHSLLSTSVMKEQQSDVQGLGETAVTNQEGLAE
eukprot:m.92415 g.92415  ORF g.92415 m.92415 type:complete len:72 (-) comp14944_c0_seq1:41-256(-)